MAYPRGEWGVRTPHFSKSWSSRFAQRCNKIGGGGGGVGQICQEVVFEILQKQAQNVFSRVRSKVLLSKKCLNTAGRGILSQSRMLIFKNFPRALPTDPLISISLLISQLEHAAGYRDPCLLPCLKQSHQNDLKSCIITHEMIQMATTISFAEASCKK